MRRGLASCDCIVDTALGMARHGHFQRVYAVFEPIRSSPITVMVCPRCGRKELGIGGVILTGGIEAVLSGCGMARASLMCCH